MVNTVALVNQQAKYIRRHLHHTVGEYSGDMNVDFWTADKWQEELSGHQVGCADGVLQVAYMMNDVLYLYFVCYADHGDDVSDIPEPSDAWLHYVVTSKLAHI
jgi:hypothetical protein